jgi:hypothetical protein
MLSLVKSHRRKASEQRQTNAFLFPKSPLMITRRRRVHFDNTIVTHQLPLCDPQSESSLSSKEYLELQIKECHLLRTFESVKMYLHECELIKRRLRRPENTDADREAAFTEIIESPHLEKHISRILFEGLRQGNCRGLESGSYRRDHTPTIVRSIVEHYHKSKRRHPFLNKTKIYEEVSMFAQKQTQPDQSWARVLALVDERVVDR